jgi:hypothetical protein
MMPKHHFGNSDTYLCVINSDKEKSLSRKGGDCMKTIEKVKWLVLVVETIVVIVKVLMLCL